MNTPYRDDRRDSPPADASPFARPATDFAGSPTNVPDPTRTEALDRTADAAMDPRLTTIQPGGGVVMAIELGWGLLRRRYLRTFRRRYVQRMLTIRQGSRGSLPFDPVDPRDMKYYRNQDSYWWADADDPFLWRDALPFVRVGLTELMLLTATAVGLALLAGWLWWPLALPLIVVAVLIVWFFRDPAREVPDSLGTVVAPADGKLVQIDRVDDPELGKCIQFGIFLSIFNVHANRVSLPGRVVAVRYQPGKFLNALRPESARENENLDVVLESMETPGKRFRIRQITGQFARRIVCWVRPGDVLSRGEMYGMIKLGSRTELLIPDEATLEVEVQVGDRVKAGSTPLAKYRQRIEISHARWPISVTDEDPSAIDTSPSQNGPVAPLETPHGKP